MDSSRTEKRVSPSSSHMNDRPDSFDQHIRRSMVGFAHRNIKLLEVKQILAEEGVVIG